MNIWVAIGTLILSLAAIAGAVGFASWLGGMVEQSGTPIDQSGAEGLYEPDFRTSQAEETSGAEGRPTT
jgi:hypothetical protein